jgi:hypothetical protein
MILMMHGESFKIVAIQNSDTGELPRRKHSTFRTRRKFKIKNKTFLAKKLREAPLQFEVDNILSVGHTFYPPGINRFTEHFSPKRNPRHGAAYVQLKQN